jgi:DNA repair protein RadA
MVKEYTPLDEIKGIGSVTAQKLMDAHVTTVELLAVQDPLDLKVRSQIAETTCADIIKKARTHLGFSTWKTGLEVEAEEVQKPRLSTGIRDWDEKLGGGIKQGSIVEFFGPASSGKTQMCAHFAVRAMVPLEQGGLEGKVLWLDSEKSYEAAVIKANMRRWGLDPSTDLANMMYAPILNPKHLEEHFEDLPKMVVESKASAVVIDSLTGKFRQQYQGMGNLKTRQEVINRLFARMQDMTMATDVIFLYTNQVLDKPMTGGGSHGLINQPSGGHIVSHNSDYRIRMSGISGNVRTFKLVDQAGLPDFELAVKIGMGGFYRKKEIQESIEPKLVELALNEGYKPPEGTYAAEVAISKGKPIRKKKKAKEKAKAE